MSLAIVLVCTPQEIRLKHHRPLKLFFSQNQSIKAGSGSFIFRYAGNKGTYKEHEESRKYDTKEEGKSPVTYPKI